MEIGRKKFLPRNYMNFSCPRDIFQIISEMSYFHVLKTLILVSICFYMDTLNFLYINNKESKIFKVKYILKL